MKNFCFMFIAMIFFFLNFTGCSSREKVFSDFERYYILSGAENEKIPLVKNNTSEGDRILRRKSVDISPDNYIAKHLAKRMKTSVIAAPGVGIAAPQVGFNVKMIWVKRMDRENPDFELYYNPEIVEYSEDAKIGWEGCLSVPAGFGKVSRSRWIRVKYDTLEKSGVVEKVEGYTAIIFQHEIDHLHGTLFIDKREKEKMLSKEEYRAMRKKDKNQSSTEKSREKETVDKDFSPDEEPRVIE
ncbi:MAG: peptide deformylase [bacterium]